MAIRPRNGIELFAGGGMLGVAVELAFPGARPVCYVEREAYAAASLVARMGDAVLAPAPVWSDVTTFDGRPWRGVVDYIAGGFPCPDISDAGPREGIRRGNRSGLWFEFVRIIREVEPRYVFVENVSRLTLRGLDIVLGTLSDLGFDAEWTTLRADEVGASHERDRCFVLAARRDLADVDRVGRGELRRHELEAREQAEPGADADGRGRAGVVAEPEGGGFGVVRESSGRVGQPDGGAPLLADAEVDHRGRGVGGAEEGARPGGQRRRGPPGGRRDVADAERARPQGGGHPGAPRGGEPVPLRGEGGAYPLLAPGPADPRWSSFVARWPHLAPSLKSKVRRVAHGLAARMVGDSIDAQESDDQQASPKSRFRAWQKVCRLWIDALTRATPSGLLEASRGRDSVPSVPSEAGRERRDMGSEEGSGGDVPDLRGLLSAEEAEALDALFRYGLSSGPGENQRAEAMASRADRLRVCGNGVVAIQGAVAYRLLARRFEGVK